MTAVLPSALVAQQPRRKTAAGAFSPKMLVYENLNNADVLRHFTRRFAQLDTLLDHSVALPAPAVRWRPTDSDARRLDSLYDAKNNHEQKALRRRSGLEITGQTYARPEEALHDAEDDDVSRYKAKIQAEVGWNIINSRFYQGREKREKIRLANELDRLQQTRQLSGSIYDEAAAEVTAAYNYYIAATTAQRLENLDILNEAFQYMLEKDRISNDKMMEVMNDKMDAEYQLSLVNAGEDIRRQPLYTLRPTRVDIDTTALWRMAFSESTDARIAQVREDIARNESRLTNYLSTTRLTPFARWSSYWTSRDHISNNADVGLRFTVPLYNEAPRRRRALDTEIEILRQNRTTDEQKARVAISAALRRVDNANRAITTESYHLRQLGRYIALRRNAYKNQKNGYSYVTRLMEYNEYLKSMERMYRLMLSRTLAVIDIQKAAGLTDTDNRLFTETQL